MGSAVTVGAAVAVGVGVAVGGTGVDVGAGGNGVGIGVGRRGVRVEIASGVGAGVLHPTTNDMTRVNPTIDDNNPLRLMLTSLPRQALFPKHHRAGLAAPSE